MPTPRPLAAPALPPPLHYRVDIGEVNAHLFRVTLTIPKPAAQQRVSLPVWIPGSYLVREFAKNLQGLQAHQGTGKGKARATSAAPSITQLDKSSWLIECQPAQPLVLTYEVYARDNSVRTAWLDADRGFFNATSVCLQVEDQEDASHVLELPKPASASGCGGWSVATGLTAHKVNAQGFGSYVAANYDELADCPVEMGTFWSETFRAGGVTHRFVVAGAAASFDGARLIADTQKICETEIRFWHGKARPPYKSYLFMLNVVDDGYGGLEHRNSTALICKRKDLPRIGQKAAGEGYTRLLGLISHEYFHTWNVKRLRPSEFTRYDYSQENYTELLWFFEGFTSYYDDLLLRRAGLVDNAGYLQLLTTTANQVLQAPGRQVQSVAQASFDAWVKYYRQDENTPNATISYYTKGALVALCLDLTLRTEGRTTHQGNLDDVMRHLWLHCKAGPMREQDLADALATIGGRSFAGELAQWVHGVGELPLEKLLKSQGVALLQEPAQLAQRLGLRVSESQGIRISMVLRGGAAEAAGFAAGDEWIGLDVAPAKRSAKDKKTASAASQGSAGSWRMSKLDDLLLYAGAGSQLTALVARDQRLLRLPLTLPAPASTCRLAVQDAALADAWLQGTA